MDLNATAAAKRAGYSEKSASRIAVELLNKTQVSAEIQKQQAKRQKRVEITQEKVLEELAAIAFANGADFATVNQNGIVRITPTSELPDEKRKAIASIKEGQYGTEVKVHDKVKALELLDILSNKQAPMTLRELYQASGYPKSTIYALLSTLRAYGCIRQESDGRYYLGMKLFQWGCSVSGSREQHF